MARKIFCPKCKYVGGEEVIDRGDFRIEAVLWLLFIIPGWCYHLWRAKHKVFRCPKCKNIYTVRYYPGVETASELKRQ